MPTTLLQIERGKKGFYGEPKTNVRGVPNAPISQKNKVARGLSFLHTLLIILKKKKLKKKQNSFKCSQTFRKIF